jgi:hypothetical protein
MVSAQKRLRDLKGRISAQSKKNFVLERDVRYLDSRIALLIQNRMALDEVGRCALSYGSLLMRFHSNVKSRGPWKKSTQLKANIQMTGNCNNIPIYSSCCNPSPGISLLSAVLSAYPKSILFFRLLCSLSMGTSTKAGKNISY